jgi:hypothetical protein
VVSVSFILTVYDGATTLRGCLDHLIAQRFADWECVAVNDASPDDCAAILADYARRDGRLRVVTHERNRGVSAARNTGLNAARGEFALFLDQDDLLYPDGVARLARLLPRFPQAAALAGCCVIVSPERRVSRELTGPDYDLTFAEVCQRNELMTPGVLMRRAVVQEVGGLEVGLEGCDDWDLWGRLTRLGRPIRRCKGLVSQYRIHAGNNTRKALHQFRACMQVLERMYAPDPRVPHCDPRWREGGRPENKRPAQLGLMWGIAVLPLLCGDVAGALAIVEHALSVLPAEELRPESAALLHEPAPYFALFAGIDPNQYYPRTRGAFRAFFARVEALLHRPGFAEAAEAALVDRCIRALAEEKQGLADEVDRYRNSRSYRLGRLLTQPLQWYRQLFTEKRS